jgi:CubicO group peptidase (beta-lactamase class C family)
MQTRILGPLQMNDTSYDIPAEKNARAVTVWRSDGTQLLEAPNPAGVISSPVQGDGGLSSTARDYAQFIRLFLNDGSLNGQQLYRRCAGGAATYNQSTHQHAFSTWRRS